MKVVRVYRIFWFDRDCVSVVKILLEVFYSTDFLVSYIFGYGVLGFF